MKKAPTFVETLFMVNLRSRNWNTLQTSLERIAAQMDELGVDIEGNQYDDSDAILEGEL